MGINHFTRNYIDNQYLNMLDGLTYCDNKREIIVDHYRRGKDWVQYSANGLTLEITMDNWYQTRNFSL